VSRVGTDRLALDFLFLRMCAGCISPASHGEQCDRTLQSDRAPRWVSQSIGSGRNVPKIVALALIRSISASLRRICAELEPPKPRSQRIRCSFDERSV
jgi:hypothetical protein